MTGRIGRTYVRSGHLAGFESLVGKRGGNASEILSQAGIDLSALKKSNLFVNWAALSTAYEIAAQRIDEPNFGIELAAELPDVFPNVAPAVLLGRTGDTMRDWFQATATHWRYYTNGYAVSVLTPADGGMIVRVEFLQHAFAPRQIVESSFATLCRLWRSLFAHDQHPAQTHFAHHQPKSTHRHVEYFGPGVAFGQDHYQIRFSREQTEMRIVENEERKRALIDWLVRRRIENFADYDQSMCQTVALVIASTLGAGVCNLDFVADSLSLNPKKLQRLLAQEGTTFSALLNSVRERLAVELLAETDIGVAQIAGLLDYAATAPFSLAVYRWHGVSPVALRHKRRHEMAASAKSGEITFQTTAR